jgi:outer membrane protein OmpA-like peptidoglycan-associated protein
MKRLVACTIVAIMASSAVAQESKDVQVPWRWGVHLTMNANMAGVGYGLWIPERPNGSFVPFELVDGSGLGFYGGVNGQVNIFPFLGIQGRLSYDGRQASVLDDMTYDVDSLGSRVIRNDEINFNLSLLTLDLLAKLYVGSSFHFTLGGGIGFKLDDTYDYRINRQDPIIQGPTSGGPSVVSSLVGGLGYHVWLSDKREESLWMVTPFIESSWVAGMRNANEVDQDGFDDVMSMLSIRAGVSLEIGSPLRSEPPPSRPPVRRFFHVTPPKTGVVPSRVTYEFSPLRPFVFFDRGSQSLSTSAPSGERRYNVLTKGNRDAWISTAKNTVLEEEYDHGSDSGRYLRGPAYYDLLNIVGYRMTLLPASTIILTGSAPTENDGLELANTVKTYLVQTWEIGPSRIVTTASDPRKPSGSSRTPAADRPLADLENRRVEISSTEPAVLRHVLVRNDGLAHEENEIRVELTTKERITTWQATIVGNGQRRSYGPFTSQVAFINSKDLLANGVPDRAFEVEVVATTADGRTLSDNVIVKSRSSLAERHVLLFDFNDPDPDVRSREFLGAIVPRIPAGSMVVISGFTDNIGHDDFNRDLSQQRADMVKRMLEEQLAAQGKQVLIRAIGYGEESSRHPLSNGHPEGRMYNRSVIVDIIH